MCIRDRHIAFRRGAGRYGCNIVGIRKGIILTCIAIFFKICADRIGLVFGVRLCRAIQDAHILGIREQLVQHGRLILQRRQIAGSGNIGSGHTGPVIDIQRGCIVSDGGSQDRDLARRCCSCLKRRCRVGQNQVHIRGYKLCLLYTSRCV